MDINLLVPKLSSDISYHKFSDDSYFIHQKVYGHRIKINNDFYDILKRVDGKKNLQQMAFDINKKDFTVELLYTILYEKLGAYGIIENDLIKVKKKGKPSYLKLSFIVIPVHIIDKITPHLKFLFAPRIMKLTILFSLFIIGIGIYNNFESITQQNLESIWLELLIFGFISVTFHEFGHVTAAHYFGAEHGGIGGGFYLFSPVYFADVTDIWKLRPNKRIIVNLAGIYFELLICSIYILAGIGIGYNFLTVIGLLIFVNTLFNLNPFLRSDGYWVLTDLLEIPNLYKKSSQSLVKLLKSLVSSKKIKTTKKAAFLSIYAAINYVFIGLFIYYVLFLDSESILYLPHNIYDFIINAYQRKQEITLATLGQFIIPILFYVLLFRILKNQVVNFVLRKKGGIFRRFTKI